MHLSGPRIEERWDRDVIRTFKATRENATNVACTANVAEATGSKESRR